MTKNDQKRSAVAQKSYRKSQRNKGLVRFELQIPEEAKERFEQMVETAAAEYEKPWDKKRRMALARTAIFDEITQGSQHEFTALKKTIQELMGEIKVLSPAFFLKDTIEKAPLPAAIHALPDDPVVLKELLAKIYSEAQEAKRLANKYQEQSNQYEKLYEAVNNYNEELVGKSKRSRTIDKEDEAMF